MTTKRVAAVASLLITVSLAGAAPATGSPHPSDHEVWLIDQSNSPGASFGGTIYIYDGHDLRRRGGSAAAEQVDLGAATADLCLAQTGAAPVRPHMVLFNQGHTHAVVAFVASGHVVFFEAASRTPVGCLRTEVGAGGARQAHAAFPTPDDRYVMVANQNGKKLERIATDYRTNTFTAQPAATLDLTAGTTPNGFPLEDPVLRPDNAPICPFVPSNGYPTFVSLRGGGMFAVDHGTTPMSIVAEYDAATIPRDGCGFTEAAGWVFANAGGANPANLHGWFLYRVPVGGSATYSPDNPPGVPEIQVLDHDESEGRDAHVIVPTRNGVYAWFFDRAANLAEVYRTRTGNQVATVDLTSRLSHDPTPDLGDTSPDGRFMYVSLRGPNPLSGDPHASTGATPGLLVIKLVRGGRAGAPYSLAPISNLDPDGVERADAHGVAVRRLS